MKLIHKLNDIYTNISYSLSNGSSLLPTMLHFEITLRCNLRCEMCFYYGGGKVPHREKMQLTKEEIFKIIDNVEKAYKNVPFKPRLGITGGEPFVRGDIFEIFKYIKKKGFKFGVVSNFSYLNKEKIDMLIKVCPNAMNISLDGVGELHDKIRGVKGTYDKAISNLEYLRKLRPTLPIRINCTLTRTNYKHIKDLIPIAKKYNCELQITHLWFIEENNLKKHNKFMKEVFGGEYDYPINVENFSDKEGAEISRNVKQIIRLGANTHPYVEDVKDYYINPSYWRANKCKSIWSKLRIDCEGNLTPCMGYNFGNLLEDSFSNILNNKRARKFRIALKKHGVFPGCRTCEWL